MFEPLVIRARRARWWVFGLYLVLIGFGSLAQPKPPGQTVSDRVVQAHREVGTAVVSVRYGIYYTRADETEFVTTDYRVVLDRPGGRVRVDRPGFTLVSDGRDIFLVAEALPGRHLHMPLDGGLTYERLVEVFPDLANPTPPALVYLLAEDPVAQFTGDPSVDATPLGPADGGGQGQIRLAFPLGQGSHQQGFDRESGLVEQVLIDLDVKGQDLEAVRFHYAFEWSAVDEPVDEAVFELDLKQSQEMTTLAAFLSPPGGGGPGGAAGQGGGAGGGTLIGLPLPEIELAVLGSEDKVKLSELGEGVVVLECFATWSKTSVLDLPALAEYEAWCKENNHAVGVYGVAVGEQAEKMTKWMEALEKTAKKEIGLTVLLDPSTEAAMALKLPTVPRTLVVVDGRVVDVFGGVKPTYLEDLKEGTAGWLEKVEDKGE